MNDERRDSEDARRDYVAPVLTVLASVEEATDVRIDPSRPGGKLQISSV
jgi:hypothetical protein